MGDRDYRKENQNPKARERRRGYMASSKGKAANRKAQENYRNKHPQKIRAQQKARSSGGDSGPHRCKVCGGPATHKHHTDYGSGGAGTIEWLCHKHHVKRHHPKSNITKSEGAVQLVVLPGSNKATKMEAGYRSMQRGEADSYACRGCNHWLEVGDCTKVEKDSEGATPGMVHGDGTCRLFSPRTMHVMKGEQFYPLTDAAPAQKPVKPQRPMKTAKPQRAQRPAKPAKPLHVMGKPKKPLTKGPGNSNAVSDTDEQHEELSKPCSVQKSGDDAVQLVVAAQAGTKSGRMGAAMAKSKEANMDREALFTEIMGRDVDALLKARSEEMQELKEDEGETSKGDYKKGETVPMAGGAVGSAGPGMAKGEGAPSSGDMAKAMNTLQAGEPSGAGLPSASQVASPNSVGGGSPAGEFSGDSKSGMPAASPGPTHIWSQDDTPEASQMTDSGAKPLEQSASGGEGGSPDLARASQQVMTYYGGGGDKMNKSLLAESDADVRRYQAVAESALRKAHAGGADTQMGVGVPAPAQQVEKAEQPGNVWRQGAVVYSDGEDQRIEKAQNAQGFITPEPTLGIPHSPLTEARSCGLCKSQYPAMFTTCPDCGGAAGTHVHSGSHGQIILEKSVADAIRPAANPDRYVPFGFKVE